ncbi:MAG TPA: pseudouridine synthase [Burkholderiaceae bacterium]|nr:pseudouridine synthase [Burkholderiaceae bacterium]
MRCGTEPRPHADIRVVWHDEHLLVLDKPTGLLSVPGKGPAGADCLSARVQARWPDALVVHRLDMATSGLMVMARGAANQRILSMAFARRLTRKRYEAVVYGWLPGTGCTHSADADGWHTIDLPLIVDWPNRPRSKVCHASGKPSLTRWRAMGAAADAASTRLELEPVTGRSHQLRVHLMSTGHPILGDDLYAHNEARLASPRLLLHATHLSLPHPATGQPMHWYSPAPF